MTIFDTYRAARVPRPMQNRNSTIPTSQDYHDARMLDEDAQISGFRCREAELVMNAYSGGYPTKRENISLVRRLADETRRMGSM